MQAQRYIRSGAHNGSLFFVETAHAVERGEERGISADEARRCILDGRAVSHEPGTAPTGDPNLCVKFELLLSTEVLKVVAAINDNDELIIVITKMKSTRR